MASTLVLVQTSKAAIIAAQAGKAAFWGGQAAQRISCPPVTLIAWPVI